MGDVVQKPDQQINNFQNNKDVNNPITSTPTQFANSIINTANLAYSSGTNGLPSNNANILGALSAVAGPEKLQIE